MTAESPADVQSLGIVPPVPGRFLPRGFVATQL